MEQLTSGFCIVVETLKKLSRYLRDCAKDRYIKVAVDNETPNLENMNGLRI